MAQAITKQLNYTTKPSAPRGRRFKRVLPSLGNNPSSGYSFGDEVTFYIPAGNANQVWDGQTAYLNFTLSWTVTATGGNMTSAQTVAWDFQAGSAIRRIDIFGSGGQLLETVDRYGALSNLLYDAQLSQSELNGLSALIGVTGDNTSGTLRTGQATSSSAAIAQNSYETITREYSIPIIASMFQLSEKYFPAYLCSDDFKIVIQLDTQTNALVVNAPTNAVLSAVKIMNPTIHMDYLELDAGAIQQMNSVFAGGEVVLHGSSYRTYETTLSSGTNGTWNTILPAKQMSVKALFTIFRRLGATAVSAGYTQSSRTNPFTGALSTFNYQVGGERFPQRPLTVNVASGITEFMAELTKAFHAWGDLEMNGQLSHTCYVSSNNVVVGDLPNTRGFAVGLNFTQVRGADDVVLSGTDFSKVTTYLEANFTSTIQGDQTVNTFVYHDILLVIDQNGMVSSKF